MWPQITCLSEYAQVWVHPIFLSHSKKDIIFSEMSKLSIAILFGFLYDTHDQAYCQTYFGGLMDTIPEKKERRNLLLAPYLWDWLYEIAPKYGCRGYSDTISKILDFERISKRHEELLSIPNTERIKKNANSYRVPLSGKTPEA